MEDEWEMLQKSEMGFSPASDPAKNSLDLEGIEGDSDGMVRSDYFALDSDTRYRNKAVEHDAGGEGSDESDNPSWVDPASYPRSGDEAKENLVLGGIEPSRKSIDFWSDSGSDGSGARKLVDFDEKGDMGFGDYAKMEEGFEGIGMKRKISGEYWSDSGSDAFVQKNYGDFERESECDRVHSPKIEGPSGESGDSSDSVYVLPANEAKAEKKRVIWWKLPLEFLKYCAFRISPVWSFPIAAAVLGFVILARRLYKMKNKSRGIQLKVSLEDKKVSLFMSRVARLNEAFSVGKRVPIVRAPLPAAGGVTPWPVMSLI